MKLNKKDEVWNSLKWRFRLFAIQKFCYQGNIFPSSFCHWQKKRPSISLFGQIGRATAVLRNKAIKDVKKKKKKFFYDLFQLLLKKRIDNNFEETIFFCLYIQRCRLLYVITKRAKVFLTSNNLKLTQPTVDLII